MSVVQASLAELLALQRGSHSMSGVSPSVAAQLPPSGHTTRPPSRPPSHGGRTGLSTPLLDIQSDDEDEPLEPSAVIYNNMLSLAEAARLKADGHLEGDTLPPSSKRPRPPHPFNYDIGHKRAKNGDSMLKRALPMQRGDHVNRFKSPMEMGFCSAKKGEELFNLFMEGGGVYVPIFEPGIDTWESLCRRSPFLVTTLILVGSKIEDAGRLPSLLQTQCKEHAENIGEWESAADSRNAHPVHAGRAY